MQPERDGTRKTTD